MMKLLRRLGMLPLIMLLLGGLAYGNSQFFAGNGSYHALNNCNYWTARMLASADIPFYEITTINAASVMWQAKKYGSET